MTLINLHGILAYEFAPSVLMDINKPKEVIDAISSKFVKFRHKLSSLSKEGVHYNILVNGKKIDHFDQLNINNKPNQIDFVPSICGMGGAAIAAIGVVAFGAGAAGVGTGIAVAGITAAQLLMSAGMMIASMGLQMMLSPKPNMQQPEALVSNVSAAKQSFLISSKANVAEQGNPVPVGYGRLRVGSSIIQTTVKSYPQSYSPNDALAGDSTDGITIITAER